MLNKNKYVVFISKLYNIVKIHINLGKKSAKISMYDHSNWTQ